MFPNVTIDEVTTFFKGTRGKVTVEAIHKRFGCDKPGKTLRLGRILLKLEDRQVIVKHKDETWQYATYAMQDATAPLPK